MMPTVARVSVDTLIPPQRSKNEALVTDLEKIPFIIAGVIWLLLLAWLIYKYTRIGRG
jgi:hypothetical protein